MITFCSYFRFTVLFVKWIHFVFVRNVLYFYILKGSRECLLKVFVFLDLFQFILRKSLRSWHYLLFHPFFKSPLLTISVQFPLLLWCYMVRGQNYCLFFTKNIPIFSPLNVQHSIQKIEMTFFQVQKERKKGCDTVV